MKVYDFDPVRKMMSVLVQHDGEGDVEQQQGRGVSSGFNHVG